MANRSPITVIIPVYGDLPSLLACASSVVRHTDLTFDHLLIVNDCGPDANHIERELLQLVGSQPGITYERNDRNLGFVETCNRAVLELDPSGNDVLLLNSDTVVESGWLDELGGVLHERPDIGVVCARSNHASLATFPPRHRNASRVDADEARSLHASLRANLPRYTVAPVAVGFCFLVRRELVDQLGLFDTRFSPGYGEENDFCRRSLAVGYKSVLANRVFVEHSGAASFSSRRKARLARRHERILRKRHPDYWADVVEFDLTGRHPLDLFAACWQPTGRPQIAYLATTPLDAGDRRTVNGLAQEWGAHLTVITATPRSLHTVLKDSDARIARLGHDIGRVWDLAVVRSGDEDARVRAAWSAPRLHVIEGDDSLPGLIGALASAPWDPASLIPSLADARRRISHRPTRWLPRPTIRSTASRLRNFFTNF